MSLNTNYDDAKQYSDVIMPEITKILKDNDIEFNTNYRETEIVILSDDTKEDILKLIESNLSTPKIVYLLLIEIVDVNDKVYIRQKIK